MLNSINLNELTTENHWTRHVEKDKFVYTPSIEWTRVSKITVKGNFSVTLAVKGEIINSLKSCIEILENEKDVLSAILSKSIVILNKKITLNEGLLNILSESHTESQQAFDKLLNIFKEKIPFFSEILEEVKNDIYQKKKQNVSNHDAIYLTREFNFNQKNQTDVKPITINQIETNSKIEDAEERKKLWEIVEILMDETTSQNLNFESRTLEKRNDRIFSAQKAGNVKPILINTPFRAHYEPIYYEIKEDDFDPFQQMPVFGKPVKSCLNEELIQLEKKNCK